MPTTEPDVALTKAAILIVEELHKRELVPTDGSAQDIGRALLTALDRAVEEELIRVVGIDEKVDMAAAWDTGYYQSGVDAVASANFGREVKSPNPYR